MADVEEKARTKVTTPAEIEITKRIIQSLEAQLAGTEERYKGAVMEKLMAYRDKLGKLQEGFGGKATAIQTSSSTPTGVAEFTQAPGTKATPTYTQSTSKAGVIVPKYEPGVGQTRAKETASGGKAREWIASIRARLQSEGYEYVSLTTAIWRRVKNNITGERPENLAAFDTSGGFREGLERSRRVPMKHLSWAIRQGRERLFQGLIKKGAQKAGVTAVTTAVGGTLAPGVGFVVGWAVGKVIDKAGDLWSKYGKKVALAVSAGVSAFLLFLAKLGTYVAAGVLSGTLAGALFGLVAGGLPGMVVGAVVGGVAGGGLGFLLQASGANLMPLAASFEAFLGSLWGGSGAITVSSGPTVALATATVVAVAAYTVVGQPGTENIALTSKVEAIEDYGPPPVFQVAKEVISPKEKVATLSPGQSVTYSINISATSDSPDQELVIEEIVDEVKAYGDEGLIADAVFTKSPQALPKEKSFTYTITTNKELKDVNLLNTVTVTAYPKSAPEKRQTLTAQAVLGIGEPKSTSPYGFPGTGRTMNVDDEHFTLYGKPQEHHAYIWGVYMPGGIDIAAPGRSEVRSTITGIVTRSVFLSNKDDPKKSNCGGIVYVESFSREYNNVYIHLTDEVTTLSPVGRVVNRGDVIGYVYPGDLPPCSKGAHIHYQVVRNGQNVFFTKGNNYGPCGQPGVIISEKDYQDAKNRYVHQLQDSCP